MTFVSAGDSANLYNNIVSAFNRGLTPVRNGTSWNSVLPPTYWANAPVLNKATAATTGGSMAAGDYRYWITSVDINGDTSTSGNQTTFSNVVEATTTGGTSTSGNNSVTLDWTAVNPQRVTLGTGAIYAKSFNIYRSQKQANGTWTAPAFLQNVTNGPTNPTTTWTDTIATPSGSPGQPVFNYYAPGTASNYYAAYFSDLGVSYNGLGYGYPYADNNGQSTNVQMNYPDVITALNVTLNPWTPSSTLTVTPSTADLVQGSHS
ncbi:MAG: hypothetical protein ACKO40_01995 [Planctomycetaceae bacterium]